jgi:hypothetical protein
MDAKAVITSQYLAALEMMKQIVSKCPDEVWRDRKTGWVGHFPNHQ